MKLRQVGLTGGAGAGKSSVARHWQQQGIWVIDLDQVGRELIESNPTVQEEIERLCGVTVRSAHGIDRRRVREIIFSDPVKRAALEKFLHPLILARFQEKVAEAAAQGKKMVVCEAALLIEGGHYKTLDELVVVSATEGLRKKRLVERDGIPESVAEAMIRAQVSEAARRKAATVVLENEGTLDALLLKAQACLDTWKKKAWL